MGDRLSSSGNAKREIGLTLFAGALLLILAEGIARGGLPDAFQWVREHPPSAALNLVAVYTLLALSIGLFGKVPPAAIPVCGILLVMSLITSLKSRYLDSPLLPWDVLDVREVYAILPVLPARALAIGIPGFVIAVCAGTVWAYLRAKKRVALLWRPILIGLAGLFWWAFYQTGPADIRSLFRVENIAWDQTLNYQANGFLVSFMMNAPPLLISQPEEYSQEVVLRLLEDNEALRQRHARGTAGPPISLIVFVSESFYDLIDIPYFASDNPLETFERLKKRFPIIRLISPSFGGNTSNVEFELLTGLSNAFLPAGAVPYDQYLKRQTPSIAHVLRAHGYRTAAIHPFYDWFWNRKNVYPLLGFEEFISLSSFEAAARRGEFVSDEALVDKIIEWLEAQRGPFFLYAVSIQNHGSYWPNRYAPDEVEVAGDYPDDLRLRLQTYITGLRDADRQLGRLLSYLKTRRDPIICLFTGDHLPSFGPDFALYREAGVVSSPPRKYSLEERMRTASVPCLVWDNKGHLIDADEIPKNISPIYVPVIVLHQLGIEMPPYLFFLLEAMKEYPVIHPLFVLKPDGELVELEKEKNHPFLRAMKVLQYDILFGRRFSLEN